MRRLLIAALVVAFHASPVQAEEDVLGRTLPDFKGRGVVVLYASQKTQTAVDKPMTELTFRLRDLDIVFVVRVDLRGIPGLFDGIARRMMRSDYAKGLDDYDKLCRDAGIAPPPRKEAELGFYMVMDSDGVSHKGVGLEKGFTEALAIAYDASGREVARGSFPRQVATIESALRAAFAKGATK